MHINELFGQRTIRGELLGNEEKPKGEWRGQEGERHELVLKLVASIPLFEGYYVAVYSFEDESGNKLVNFAGKQLDWLVTGETYRIKATVKARTVYRGWKQTQINRLKNLGMMVSPDVVLTGDTLEEKFLAI
jgi:hypothetical protein